MKPRSPGFSALLAGLIGVAACAGGATPPAVAPPPPRPRATAAPAKTATPEARERLAIAPRRPVTHTYFGTKVVDDYEWLEDGDSPEVKAFTEAENARARAYFDAIDGRAKLRGRVEALLAATSRDYRAVRHVPGKLFVLVVSPPKQQPMLVVRDESAAATSEHVVVDPSSIDPSGKTTIDFFAPSPDGKLVAVSLSKGGSESGDLHVFDVGTGKETGDTIPRVNGGTAGGSVAWLANSTAFYYTRYPRRGERPEADVDFYQQVFRHDLGKPASEDTYALGKELPRVAEIELERSDDGSAILARVANGDGGEYEHHVLVAGSWKRLSRFSDGLTRAVFAPDGTIYAVALKGSPRGKVVAFKPPYDAPPVEVVPEGSAVVEDLVATSSALYLVEVVGGPSRVRRVPLGGKPEPLARETPKHKPAKKKKGDKKKGAPPKAPEPVTIPVGARGVAAAELPIPPVSSVGAVERVGDDLLLRIESFVDPPAWYRYDAKTHKLDKTPLAKAPVADMSDVDVVRETCTSKDGTKVPLTILRKKDAKLDGTMPTLLTGYGGFGVSLAPRMRPWHRVWLDHGGAVAQANLRGGGEMGEAWHAAGKLTEKQNVFDDFAACERALVDLGYTTPAHLAITGRSNGGLLMGAALVQHPEAVRAVVAAVGLYDMLRSETTPNGAFNVTEYGSVKDEAQLRAILAYSPFHNVRDGVAYPAVLFTTGANDPRVDPFHSRKMVARLQAATSSDRPILLRASSDTGHGFGTPLAAAVDETTDELAFLLHELGVPLR